MEKKKQKVYIVGIAPTFTSWGIFPIYRACFTNLLLILGIKFLNFEDKISFSYQGLIFREIRDLETGKSVDKYIYIYIYFFFFAYFPFSYAYP